MDSDSFANAWKTCKHRKDETVTYHYRETDEHIEMTDGEDVWPVFAETFWELYEDSDSLESEGSPDG